MKLRQFLPTLALMLVAAAHNGPAHAEPASRVFLNGVPSPVFFNDGDSFRVLGGRHQGVKARLGGFNALETPGPVHQWGRWTAKELYVNAKQAALHGRRGVWRCTSKMETDTYGRTLWWCPDLAEDLIRRGLAHALSITDQPADAKLLEAQAEAIRERRGMWAHGVPDYILTSLHSADTDLQGKGTYNRLVSTRDGSSLRWLHDDVYKECDVICDEGVDTKVRTDAAIATLREDPSTKGLLTDATYKDDKRMTLLVNDFNRGRSFAKRLAKAEHEAPIRAVLERLKAEGKLGRTVAMPACHVYVMFERRYGGGKAACLK
jgi:endonuclease YncB( thermonuclease family)